MAMDSAVPDAPGQRMLAAIVFTDAVGFSARVGQDEEGTLALIKQDLDIMSSLCTRFEGKVIKSTGDGLMMMFMSAVQAVSCALEIQKILIERAKGIANAFMHRIGVHLGDVLVSNGDALGDGVNVAARLEQEAEPGGICLSQTVYDVVKNRLFLEAARIGDLKLKNIAEPVAAYRIAGVGKAKKHKKVFAPNWALVTVISVILLGAAAGGTAWWIKGHNEPQHNLGSDVDRLLNDVGNLRSKEQATSEKLKKLESSSDSGESKALSGFGDLASDAMKMANGAQQKASEEMRKESKPADQPGEATSGTQTPATVTPPETSVSRQPSTSTPSDATPSEGDGTPRAATESAAFQDAWQQYARHYDFKGMADWVVSNPSQVPANQEADQLAQRYRDLDGFIGWFTSQLSLTSKARPITFQWGNDQGSAYQMPNGRVIVNVPRGQFVRRLATFFPNEVLQLARAMILQDTEADVRKANIRKQIQLFHQEMMEHVPAMRRNGNVGSAQNP